MARHFIFFILLLFVVSNPKGQHRPQDTGYRKFYDYAERLFSSDSATDESDSLAISSYNKVISVLTKSNGNDSILFDSYVKSGILEMSHQHNSAALKYYLNSLSLAAGKKSIPDSSLFKSYLYCGSIYYTLFNFDSALFYYRHAEDIINAFPLMNESERLYNKLGVLYFETGDYKKSIQHFEKALSLVEAQKTDDVVLIVNYKNNIASALRKLRRYDEALQIYKSLLPYHVNTQEILHNIAVTYLDAGDSKQAIQYLRRVQYNNTIKYNDLARAYIKLKIYDSAHYFLQKAMSLRVTKLPAQKGLDYGITLKYMADWLMINHLTMKALEQYQQAIIQVDPDFSDSNIIINPQSFYGLHNSFQLFDILNAKANAFSQLFFENNNLEDLKNSFATYISALSLAGHVERMYHSDESKLFLEQNVSEAYKRAVETGLHLYDITKERTFLLKAFNFAESSKASVLQTSLHELELNNIYNVPGDLLKEQNMLKAIISKLDMEIAQATGSSITQQLQKKLRDQEIRLSSLQDKLDADPRYYRLKFDNREINVDSIQQKILAKDEILLSYYYYKNNMFCFYMTVETFGYLSSVVTKDFFGNIGTLRKQLNSLATADRKLTGTLSTTLYKQLFAPVANKLNNKKRLLIIPYNEISYIPFEMLTANAEDKPLLYKYAIGYNYSARFLVPPNDTRNEYRVLAMAPFTTFSNTQNLKQLTYSKQEIEGLEGRTFFDQEATKQQFMSVYKEFPILHLATHAVINDSFPLRSYIEFYNTKPAIDTSHRLYEQEIYHLNMQKAQLVILSACETGNGQLINEEGVISLSRAFSYAGCKSAVTSLWKADDAATAFIIKKLHSYLKKGFAKDEALQKAKIDYLESKEIEMRFKTPAYWAHLVLIGNNEPIVQRFPLLYVIAGICIIVLIIFFIKRNRTQKSAYGSST